MTGILSGKVSALPSGIFEFTPLAPMFSGENQLTSLPSLASCPKSLPAPARPPPSPLRNFFTGRIRNEHTRQPYLIAAKRFLAWAEARGLELQRIAPKDVGQYMDGLRNESTSAATRKQHLAALRHYFDGLVTRHAIILNPALSVRGERYQVVEGKTPEITV
jgi:hypothetical protein